MKTCKKGLVIFLSILLMTALAGCGGGSDIPEAMTSPVRIATLNGPTGIGMAQLMEQTDKYEISVMQAPTDVVAKVINGEVDVAAVPSNIAAVLYAKTEGKIQAVSPITMGVLYILGNDVGFDAENLENPVAALAGKTIVASGKGGAPEYILKKILSDAGLTAGEDVQVEWLANHNEVNTKLLAEPGTIAMLPEPFVSVAMASGKDGVSELFDLNALWEESTGEELPMGVLVAQKSFIEERGDDLKLFLHDYAKSVEFVNENTDESVKLIVEKGFIGKEVIAKTAVPRCNIVLFDGDSREDGRAILKTFNQILFDMEPASVGGKMPDEDFYY